MNVSDIMKQAQEFQANLSRIQNELAEKQVVGSAGGGMITATVNGKNEVLGISIEKELVNPDEVQMLQDLIVAAVNDGLAKAKELSQGELGKLTGGMKIPGLF